MINKIMKKVDRDELFLHKLFGVLGVFGGLMIGFIISDKADKYEFLLKEVIDESQEES